MSYIIFSYYLQFLTNLTYLYKRKKKNANEYRIGFSLYCGTYEIANHSFFLQLSITSNLDLSVQRTCLYSCLLSMHLCPLKPFYPVTTTQQWFCVVMRSWRMGFYNDTSLYYPIFFNHARLISNEIFGVVNLKFCLLIKTKFV